MLPVKKIYIDTKYKTKDSKSNANFKFELPVTLYMPNNTAFFIDDVTIPHSWYTVEDFNDKLYFRVTVGFTHNDYVISLQKQLYNGSTLATEIQTKMTEFGYTPTVIYNATKQTISISIESFNFQFLTNTELQAPKPIWKGANDEITN